MQVPMTWYSHHHMSLSPRISPASSSVLYMGWTMILRKKRRDMLKKLDPVLLVLWRSQNSCERKTLSCAVMSTVP
jgi:hypothetical protein